MSPKATTELNRAELLVAAARKGLAAFKMTEIAQRAGTSVTTVRHVLDTVPGPSDETKERVLTVLGYSTGNVGERGARCRGRS